MCAGDDSGALAAGPMLEPPVIHFIGPHRGSAGRPVLLVWKVGWPSDGGADDTLGAPRASASDLACVKTLKTLNRVPHDCT